MYPKSVFLKPEPRELVWKSVWSILHRISASIFSYFSKISKSIISNYLCNNKSEPYLKDDCICTVFLKCLPNRFCFKPEPHELVCKSVTAILHRIFVSIFIIFFKLFNSKFGTRFPYFHIPDPENVFLGLGTFWYVQEFTDVFTNLQMFHKLSLILDKSWSYIPSRQYGTSPFSETSLTHMEISSKGVSGKSDLF